MRNSGLNPTFWTQENIEQQRQEEISLNRLPRTQRLSLEDSWDWLQQAGYELRFDAEGKPQIPSKSLYDSGEEDEEEDYTEEVGLMFFRTLVGYQSLDGLTIPRTYFGRSSIESFTFQNTDLHESCFLSLQISGMG